MIEMPEAATISRQMQETLAGKTFAHFTRGPLTHTFLWLNKPAEEYDSLLAGNGYRLQQLRAFVFPLCR
jgi:hypothetical protein